MKIIENIAKLNSLRLNLISKLEAFFGVPPSIIFIAAALLIFFNGRAQVSDYYKTSQSSSRLLQFTNTSFKTSTGDYILSYKKGWKYVRINRRNSGESEKFLALQPGGGERGMDIFNPSQIEKIDFEESRRSLEIKIIGRKEVIKYIFTIKLPKNQPGLINSKLEIIPEIKPESNQIIAREFFKGEYPELAYLRNDNGVISSFQPKLTHYFNGSPKAYTYHTVNNDSAAIPDLNQFIFLGDETILSSTLQYYVDFTSLNSSFDKSDSNIFKTVRQPAESLQAKSKDEEGNKGTFGYDIPKISNTEFSSSLLVNNSWIYLKPKSFDINDPLNYTERFVDGYSIFQSYVQKPQYKFKNWPYIVENGFEDLLDLEKEDGSRLLYPQANLGSIRRYHDRFPTLLGEKLLTGANHSWSSIKPTLPYRDAWQFLFPLIMAGEYGIEFHNSPAMEIFLKGADNALKAGRELDYIFPLRIQEDFSNPDDFRNEYDCTGAFVYLMLQYYKLTGREMFLKEAKNAGDKLLKMGFEFPYEFTTTSLGPIAMLRLYKATDNKDYLKGINIPLAAILRHSWLFNPSYGVYRDRNIFLLTEGMPAVYANGWEEGALIRNLNLFLKEGQGIINEETLNIVSEILRWKALSISDGLAPLLPNKSIIYHETPREWHKKINMDSYVPLEGFGYLEWDSSGLHDMPGKVSQSPYCFGMLPEAALLLFQKISEDIILYSEVPMEVQKKGSDHYSFKLLGKSKINFHCRISNNSRYKIAIIPYENAEEKAPLELAKSKSSDWLEFTAEAGKDYSVLMKPK